MKTSNIISVAFITFVLAGMITMYVVTKNHDISIYKNLYKEKIALESFSVIVADNQSRIYIESGDSNLVTLSYLGDKKVLPSQYLIKNDTLYISNSTMEIDESFLIQCVKVQSIISRKNSNVTLFRFSSDSLSLFSENSQIQLNNSLFENKDSLKVKLNIYLSIKDNSTLQMNDSHIKKMNILAENSRLYIRNNQIEKFNVSLERDSYFEGIANKCGKTHFNADQTSTYYLSQD